MKEKTKLRVIQILCIVSLLITVFSIQRTYAKYYEQIGTTYATNIKRWVINVNNTNIHNGVQLSQIMEPVFIENEHMNNNNNTLVPGRQGYFEFLINYSKVDVAFKFQFDIQHDDLEDFEIYGYSIVTTDEDSGEDIETITTLSSANNLQELTQVINPTTDITKSRKIRILFRWNDDTTATMDNLEDTTFKGDTNTGENADGLHTIFRYNVKITFTQTV